MAMELAMELELEDDVFFADISKQISLLIMDEDEHVPVSVCSSVSLQGLLGSNRQTAAAVSPYVYEQSCRTRESKGTGVFIPRSSQPRRKHNNQKQGRFNSFNPKPQFHQQRHYYQQQDNSSTLTYNNNNNTTTTTLHASNSRRTYRDAASIYT